MAYVSETSGIIDHAFLKNLYNGISGYGVVTGLTPSVTGSSMVVSIAAGSVKTASGPRAYAGGSVTITAAHATLPRMDAVIWDDSANSIAKLDGTATAESATQSRPPLTDLADPNDLLLAMVYVTAASTTIPSGNLFDRRIIIPGSGNFVIKTSDQNVISSVALVDCTQMLSSVAANTVYGFNAFIPFVAPTAGDIKFAFTCPAGAAIGWGMITELASDGMADFHGMEIASAATEGADGLGATQTWVIIQGYLSVGATAGTLQLQFAQQSSTATNTTISTGAWMRVQTAF